MSRLSINYGDDRSSIERFYRNKKAAVIGGFGYLESNFAIELIRLEACIVLIDAMLPLDIYSVNKLAGELYQTLYRSAYGMRTTSLRINSTFGPRHQRKHSKYGILNLIIRLAIENQTIPIKGSGGQLRNFN
jgi:nucleoside-diphosphate-sugar epimerase